MLYPKRESSTLELKREVPQYDQIVKTIIGFCNQNGGKLVIGVGNDRRIIGLSQKQVDHLLESLEQTIYQSSVPPIIPVIYPQTLGDKTIVVIEVSAGMQPPYHRHSEGLDRGTYIRLGRSTLRADGRIIQELSWKARGISYDRTPVYHATPDELDSQKFENFLQKRKNHGSFQATDELFAAYHMTSPLHGQIYPSVAGTLLFGRRPQHHLPEAMMICSHFRGVSGRDSMVTVDCEGTLFEQYDRACEFVISRLGSGFTIRGFQRDDVLEVPENALREAILNAIIHRNYHNPAPSKIAIYDDRIEIYSPGTFPGPLDVTDLGEGISFMRNHAICRVFRESGLVEKLGSGFITIFQEYERARLQEPVVIEGPGFIKLVLPRLPLPSSALHETVDELKMLAQLGYDLSIHDVVETLGVSRASATRRLREWVESGAIERRGTGPSTRYRVRGVVNREGAKPTK